MTVLAHAKKDSINGYDRILYSCGTIKFRAGEKKSIYNAGNTITLKKLPLSTCDKSRLNMI